MALFTIVFFSTLTFILGKRSFNTDKSVKEAFGDRKFSFDVDENWKLCMSRNETIEFDESIKDYTKILNDTLKSLSKKGGGSILLGSGVFPITVPILMPKMTCLVGEGKKETTLRVKNKSYPPYPFKGTIIAHKVERVSIVGLTIDGNMENQVEQHKFRTLGRVGVYQERVHHSFFLNVKVMNNMRHGFDLHGSDDKQAYHIAMDGCESSDNGEDGLRLDQTHYVGIANTVFARNGRHGIAASTSAERFKINNVQFVLSGKKMRHGCGIHMDGLSKKGKDRILREIHISNSAFRESSLAGVCMRYVEDVSVVNSSIVNMKKRNSSCYYVRNVKSFDTNSTDCVMLSGISFIPAKIKVERKASSMMFGDSPGCPKGIAYFDVCCPMQCGTCGKPGCAQRGGKQGKNDACCYSETKRKEDYCSAKNKAPCVLRNVGTPKLI